MSSQRPEHRDVAIESAKAERDAPGELLVTYTLGPLPLPQGWLGFFREAFSLTIRTVGSLDRVTGDGVVLRVAEAQATEHGLGQVRAALDQAIATANRRSKAH